MPRMVVLLLAMIFSASAQGETLWKGTSEYSVVDGTGDVLDGEGAAIDLSAESTGKASFIGAITSLDSSSLRGKNVRVSGRLRVDGGTGAAALWVRVDGPRGRLAFASSGGMPVRAGEGARERELLLYVPEASTSIKFGVTLGSAGALHAERLTLTSAALETTDVSAYDVMAHALPLIRVKALNTGNVNWPAEEAALLTGEQKKLPPQEAYAGLRRVLDALADRHSLLQTPNDASQHRAQAVRSRPIESRSIADIGYILVPGLRGIGTYDRESFTAELCSRIATLAPTSTKGWIVDLRQDNGGNMWPMLNGLHSLLGDRDAGGFRDRQGKTRKWRSRTSPECRVDLSDSRVAVLVGPKTASSGEAVAVAFRARPGTRFFGQPTAGLATSNTTFPLPDGGALLLTTAAMADREGTEYPKGIVPESIVRGDQDAIEMAAHWLRSVP
ncbi:S41 family peptidase [Stenotrophomonas maltophilia]|uniref:S41 family peptidase n=1 Tax=Stenotrophomonas maltophilia TaxID=40324 RepID=UPI000DA8DB7D|nr:S41 family peptidase [Stenotrophomonas maltophilia]